MSEFCYHLPDDGTKKIPFDTCDSPRLRKRAGAIPLIDTIGGTRNGELYRYWVSPNQSWWMSVGLNGTTYYVPTDAFYRYPTEVKLEVQSVTGSWVKHTETNYAYYTYRITLICRITNLSDSDVGISTDQIFYSNHPDDEYRQVHPYSRYGVMSTVNIVTTPSYSYGTPSAGGGSTGNPYTASYPEVSSVTTRAGINKSKNFTIITEISCDAYQVNSDIAFRLGLDLYVSDSISDIVDSDGNQILQLYQEITVPAGTWYDPNGGSGGGGE